MLFFDIYGGFPDKLGCMIGETSYNNFLAYFGETGLSLKRYWWTRWRKDKWIFDLIINLCSSTAVCQGSISRVCATMYRHLLSYWLLWRQITNSLWCIKVEWVKLVFLLFGRSIADAGRAIVLSDSTHLGTILLGLPEILEKQFQRPFSL
ncbi:unnamed protein product, partial [Musa textilis]